MNYIGGGYNNNTGGAPVVVGKQYRNGVFVATQTTTGEVLGILGMVVIMPVVGLRWVVQTYGWPVFIAGVVALIAIAIWMWRTRPGQVVAVTLAMFLGGLVFSYILGGVGYLLWKVAGTLLESS